MRNKKVIILFSSLLIGLASCANNITENDETQNSTEEENNETNDNLNEEENEMEYNDVIINNFDILNVDQVKYFGRYVEKDTNNKNSVYFGFTGTGFELYVDVKDENSSINLTLFSELIGGNTTQYIKTFIDGKEENKIELVAGEQTIELFQNLPQGKHTLKMLKLNEASVSKLAVISLTYNGNIDFYQRVYKSKRKTIEFYGDSLTCGYGNLGNSSIKTFRTIDEDGSQSYAQLLADKLDYDASIIACSGISLTKSFAPYGVDMMQQYDTVEGAIKYDMKKTSPDILVMNLGSNDNAPFTDGILTEETMKSGLEEFTKNYEIITDIALENNPSCKIISLYNMCYSIDGALVQAIKDATDAINSKYGDGTAYSIQLNNNQSGANGHPDLMGHKISADTIYKFIEKNELNK